MNFPITIASSQLPRFVDLANWVSKTDNNSIAEPKIVPTKLAGVPLIVPEKGQWISWPANAFLVKSIPKQIPDLRNIEVRGELIMSKADFEMLNKEIVKDRKSVV